ncbi:hypothetical protein [Paenibacillus tengchongensis]|uniref:hypothetical protein n=1 Tax=Paenibacillus tengchongensis TaxID=2608684 RepID=UPI00124D7BF6|nr:hypothetical protein [Paenibacillus tengchongensis]
MRHKFHLLMLVIVVILTGGCTFSVESPDREETPLYEGPSLTLGVIGEPPEVREHQVNFIPLALNEMENEGARLGERFDAVLVMKEYLSEAAESRYAGVYQNADIPFFFIESKKSYMPFVLEDLSYDAAPDAVGGMYATGYYHNFGDSRVWGFNPDKINERNIKDTYSRMFTTISLLEAELGHEPGKTINPAMYSRTYYSPTINSLDEYKVWIEGDVVLTAQIATATGEQAHQADTVFSSIRVDSKLVNTEIVPDQKPLGLHSFASSASGKLAVHVRDHEGSRLFLLDLISGEQILLNELNVAAGAPSHEKIDSYNWSPDGTKLAIAYGEIGSSHMAVYDTETQILSDISDQNFIWIPYVVWHKDGQGLDFISKQDDALNSAVLYRYRETDQSLRTVVGHLTEQEQQAFAKFTPFRLE